MIRKAVVASALFAFAVASAGAQDTGIALGTMAPGAAVHMLDGTAVNLSSYIGKTPVVIEFWATWCPLCKQLEPQLAAAKEKYAGQVTFIGLAVPQSETPEKVKAFVDKYMMKGTWLFDTDGAAVKAFTAPHTSYLIVIDKGGKVVYTGVGGTQDVEAAIAKLGPMKGMGTSMGKGGR